MGALRRLISRLFLYGGIGVVVESVATRYLLDEALDLSLWQKLAALAVVLILMAVLRRRVRAPRRERGIRAALRALR